MFVIPAKPVSAGRKQKPSPAVIPAPPRHSCESRNPVKHTNRQGFSKCSGASVLPSFLQAPLSFLHRPVIPAPPRHSCTAPSFLHRPVIPAPPRHSCESRNPVKHTKPQGFPNVAEFQSRRRFRREISSSHFSAISIFPASAYNVLALS